MDLSEKRERWSRMLVQAERFAELENTLDAAGRAKSCLAEIEATQNRLESAEARAELAGILERARRACAEHERLHQAWLERVREREARYRAYEQDVYQKPLPVDGIE
jgi:hypothetical protein